MIPKTTRYADRLIVIFAYFCAALLYGETMYQYGKTQGQALKCAEVPGKEVVSTTKDTCTYANSYGRSTIKRAAI